MTKRVIRHVTMTKTPYRHYECNEVIHNDNAMDCHTVFNGSQTRRVIPPRNNGENTVPSLRTRKACEVIHNDKAKNTKKRGVI